MKRIFLALVLGVVGALPGAARADVAAKALKDYERCVKSEVIKIANATASATEIALAAIHRCEKARLDFWFYELERFGKAPIARKHADDSLAKQDENLTRMAISEVIDARMR